MLSLLVTPHTKGCKHYLQPIILIYENNLNKKAKSTNDNNNNSPKPLFSAAELDGMSAKDRRSAKRKMEALAAESLNVDVKEFRKEEKKKEKMEE